MSASTEQRHDAEQWFYEKKWNNFRRGSRKGKLRWQSGAATVQFYDHGAPKTVEVVLRALPSSCP